MGASTRINLRDDARPSHIPNRTTKARAWRDGFVTVTDLISIGWTERTLREHLGAPDEIRKFSARYQGLMRLYRRADVLEVMSREPVQVMLSARRLERFRARQIREKFHRELEAIAAGHAKRKAA